MVLTDDLSGHNLGSSFPAMERDGQNSGVRPLFRFLLIKLVTVFGRLFESPFFLAVSRLSASVAPFSCLCQAPHSRYLV
ncbi:hypothetical protein BFX80_14655 [Cobetia marina]|nr:hypothetical protein BFX80_14655 [Cobetia marina]